MLANIKRLTVVLPIALDSNAEIYALQNRITKGRVIEMALFEFLKKAGLEPDKMPKQLEIEYDE
jgi:hypothetical protein